MRNNTARLPARQISVVVSFSKYVHQSEEQGDDAFPLFQRQVPEQSVDPFLARSSRVDMKLHIRREEIVMSINKNISDFIRRYSNQRMRESKSRALPLGDTPRSYR